MTVNRWKPDTCGCVIEYEFDADAPSELRTHTAKAVVHACQAHPEEEKSSHFAKVLGENRLKNQALADVLSELPDNRKTKPGVDGWFLEGEEPGWEFDGNRELIIRLKPTHGDLKAAVSSAVAGKRQKVRFE